MHPLQLQAPQAEDAVSPAPSPDDRAGDHSSMSGMERLLNALRSSGLISKSSSNQPSGRFSSSQARTSARNSSQVCAAATALQRRARTARRGDGRDQIRGVVTEPWMNAVPGFMTTCADSSA